MLKTTLPAVFALFFVGAGINHFVRTGSYLRMMPRYVPLHLAMVQISGGRSRTVRAACVRERHPHSRLWCGAAERVVRARVMTSVTDIEIEAAR